MSDDGPITGLSTGTGAVVRKPSGTEPAGCGPQRCSRLYGDFDTTVEDAAADEVAGGVIAEPRGGSDGARVAGQEGSKADPRLAGCWLGRALSRPVVNQRDRSGQQRRMRLPGHADGSPPRKHVAEIGWARVNRSGQISGVFSPTWIGGIQRGERYFPLQQYQRASTRRP